MNIQSRIYTLVTIIMFLLAFILVSPTEAAQKETFTLTWEAPTERENGVAIEPGEMLRYTIQITNPIGLVSNYVIGPSANSARFFIRSYPGDYLFTMTACLVCPDCEDTDYTICSKNSTTKVVAPE